jgi:hypothetical protein
VKYYFKPAYNFGYTPLPNIYKGSEAAVLQKEHKKQAKQYEVQSIYKFLLSNLGYTGDKVISSTGLQAKVYQENIEVPDKVPEVEESIVGVHPEQITDSSTGELITRLYDYSPGAVPEYDQITLAIWAKRVVWFNEYQKGPKGYTKTSDLPTTYLDWSEDFYGIYCYTRCIPPGFTAYESGFIADDYSIDY